MPRSGHGSSHAHILPWGMIHKWWEFSGILSELLDQGDIRNSKFDPYSYHLISLVCISIMDDIVSGNQTGPAGQALIDSDDFPQFILNDHIVRGCLSAMLV